MKTQRLFVLCSLYFALSGCKTGACRFQEDAANKVATPPPETSLVKPSLSERVLVAKPDGSLQCEKGKKIPVESMRGELKNIEVYAQWNKQDSLMRATVCGNPTGFSNVYQIPRKDLAQALKLGFTEWTEE